MKILLISGDSGTGKTLIANKLAEQENYHLIKSFTDRPQRSGTTYNDHQFVSKAIMKFILTYDIAAFTTIDGYHYCATFSQFDNKKINVYVVDKKGIDDIKEHFKDAQIYSVLVIKDNVHIDQSRKDRNIVIPTPEDVDMVLENNTNINDVVGNLKQTISLFFEG